MTNFIELQNIAQWYPIFNNEKYILLDFTATWCGPCKQIAPFFKELSSKYLNVTFVKVDVDKFDELCNFYDVTLMPTFVLLENKIIKGRVNGANTEKIEKLIQTIEELDVKIVEKDQLEVFRNMKISNGTLL